MKLTNSTLNPVRFTLLASTLLLVNAGCHNKREDPDNRAPGTVLQQSGMSALQDQTANALGSAPPGVMKGGGLVAVMGGTQVRAMKTGTHEILLCMPQLTEAQIPVSYAIITTPQDAAKEYRLQQRDGSNVVLSVLLNAAKDQEMQIDWSSILLVADQPTTPGHGLVDPYRKGTACVQVAATQVRTLAEKLWPATGNIEAYAAAIQEFIRTMKQQQQPRSMDAVGILASGGNWICTANANLAAALLRAKDIPARSLAVVPPIGQRLEMHRVVEYSDRGQWHKFDPSSLQREIPLKPWQNIIMASTTIADEEVAMKPRMGSAVGCPYAQEVEFLSGSLTLWGKDFFWTIGKPLAEFQASAEALDLARKEWSQFLERGQLSQSQIKAASTRNAADFLAALKAK